MQKEKGDPGSNPGPGGGASTASTLTMPEPTASEVRPTKRKLESSLREDTKRTVQNVTSSSLGQAPGVEQLQQLGQPELPEQLLPDQPAQAMRLNEALTDLNDDKVETVLFDENLNNKLDTFSNYGNSFDNNSGYNNSCDNNSYDFNIDDEADEVEFQGL